MTKKLLTKGGSPPKTLSKPKKAKRAKPNYAPPVKSTAKPAGKALVKKEAPPVKSLVKPPPPPKKPTSAPMPITPKGFKWKGAKKDSGRFSDHRLAPLDRMPDTYPRPRTMIVPDTFVRLDPQDKPTCLVTRMPDGVMVAWDTCGICNNYWMRCLCVPGFVQPRGVEWIYITSKAKVDGEPFDHPMDASSYKVTSRALQWYRGKETGHVRSFDPPRPNAHQQRASAAELPPAPVLKALRGGKSLSKPDPDMATLNRAAAEATVDAEATAMKRLSKPVKKTLIKKGK